MEMWLIISPVLSTPVTDVMIMGLGRQAMILLNAMGQGHGQGHPDKVGTRGTAMLSIGLVIVVGIDRVSGYRTPNARSRSRSPEYLRDKHAHTKYDKDLRSHKYRHDRSHSRSAYESEVGQGHQGHIRQSTVVVCTMLYISAIGQVQLSKVGQGQLKGQTDRDKSITLVLSTVINGERVQTKPCIDIMDIDGR